MTPAERLRYSMATLISLGKHVRQLGPRAAAASAHLESAWRLLKALDPQAAAEVVHDREEALRWLAGDHKGYPDVSSVREHPHQRRLL